MGRSQQKETKGEKKEYNTFLIFEISHSEPHWVQQFEWTEKWIENFPYFPNLAHLNTCLPFLDHWRVHPGHTGNSFTVTPVVSTSVVVLVTFSIFRGKEGWTAHQSIIIL